MRIKEVRISATDRFVICHNPESAERDKHTREQLVAQLTDLITDTDTSATSNAANCAAGSPTSPA